MKKSVLIHLDQKEFESIVFRSVCQAIKLNFDQIHIVNKNQDNDSGKKKTNKKSALKEEEVVHG